MKKTIKILVFAVLIIALTVTPFIYKRIQIKKVEIIPLPTLNSEFLKKGLNSETKTQGEKTPSETFIQVPFAIQAPNANWDALHEEACEEASLIMLAHFLKKTDIGGPDQWEREIQDLVSWENAHGYGQDVTMKELAQISKDYYGLNTATIKTDITVDDIKQELAMGHPVIIPAAGKILPNPNFRNGGPNYHNLVITGYDSRGFITNDPGTRNGENFRYTFDSLFNALHDYNSQNMFYGAKTYLVFE